MSAGKPSYVASAKPYGLAGIDHGNGLDLQQNGRIGESDDRYQRRDRKVFLQYFAPQLEKSGPMTLILEKDRHVNQIGKLRARLGELRFDVAKALACLALDIEMDRLARRIAVARLTGDPDMSAADRLDDRRITSLRFERTGKIFFVM